MSIKNDLHVYLARLLATARQKKGYKTIKEIYQIYKPSVDYQTWSCAESGRRIPHPNSLLEMAKILDIDKQDLLIAYSKDKFLDEECHQILDTFPIGQFVDVDSLLGATDHATRHDFVLSSKQVDAMRKDIRLRLFMLYTYDQDLKTNFDRLCNFFNCEKSEAKKVTKKLEKLGLVEIVGEEVKRIQKHTTLPSLPESFDLRKQVLLSTLDLNTSPDSYFTNSHLDLTESSFKKIMDLIYFTRANLIRLEKSEKLGKKSRFQIAIVANTIGEGNDEKDF